MESLNFNGISEGRIKVLNTPPRDGESVLYVMTRDQRLNDNFGLCAAQQYAMTHKLPFAVAFSFIPTMPGLAREHFDFMVAGLRELEHELALLNIPFISLFGMHEDTMTSLAFHTKPAAIFTDFSPLVDVRKWQKALAKTLPIMIVDSHNIVPVWVASNKQEFSARTIRPKIHAHLAEYALDAGKPTTHPHTWPGTVLTLNELNDRIEQTRAGYLTNGTRSKFKPGEKAAQIALQDFLFTRLKGYAEKRNDPTIDGQSNLSPYLHFGSIGSITAVRAVMERVAEFPSLQRDAEVFIEEIVIRKELSDNFCLFAKEYTSLSAAPEWARVTLQKHKTDPREFIYTTNQFENAQTHDIAWNAAQTELRKTGKMHGYMRMYWAKKVLEWSATPEDALSTLLYLNDFYSLDGGDPNGYAGILWSIAGLHDRPWGERQVYGTVRSMVYNGLKRKFDIIKYEQKWV